MQPSGFCLRFDYLLKWQLPLPRRIVRRSALKLSDTEAAYAAGIVDGEGSIYFSRNHKTRWPSPIVSVASTDRELLEWLRARVGGTIIQKRTYQPQHARSYDWKLTDRRALEFLKLVQPFLVIQRKQVRCEMLLTKYLECTPRNGRYTAAMTARKQDLIERFSSLP